MSAFIRSRSLGVSAGNGWGLGHFGQELVVGLERLHSVEQQLEAGPAAAATLTAGETREHPAQLPHHVELVTGDEQLFVPGRRGVDIDSRVDAALGELAIEAQLHVAGALELLE